jgi:hypothetical protein
MAVASTKKPFDNPLTLRFADRDIVVSSVAEATELLADVNWPERGPRHRDAYETCLKVLDGHRTTENARRELIEAAREAGILSEG